MLSLHPEIQPLSQHSLSVGDGHVLHLEEFGRLDGIPVVFLHGGPGAGCEAYHPRFFDPDVYRIILYDQRGCGRSTPHASLEANTTWHLVEDLERIRTHLGVERWMVFGGSWGSTLALAYGQRYPERVTGMVLRGVFLCRPQDIQWFYQEGASRVFPERWQKFVEPIPEAERGSLLNAYHRRLFGANELERMSLAKSWSVWEGSCLTLTPNPTVISHFASSHLALSLARIESDYFVHDCYLEPDQLLRDASRLRDVPAVIVHGRYDMVCPVEQAHTLHQAWPEADLQIIPDAGHAASEPGIIDALVRATNQLAGVIRDRRRR